ncbi:MAG TPA: polysaccharide deacetylase family protein [Candidatus Acidoferrum sp.]|nr:polysaccharide deacetylase family protein [Candidatus Acidoferrum sp.]
MSQTDRKLLVTTSWDDGHPLDLRLAELLEKYGIAATFYIPRKNGHAVLSEEQIVELSRRFEIGAHTLDHVYLDRVSDAQASEQLSGSRRWIEDVTGKSCRIFCFPAGKYRNHQLSLVSKAGFAAARTAELLSVQPPRREAGLFLVPTTVQVFPHRPYAYAKNALKRHKPAPLLWSGALFRSKDWTALARHLFSRALGERGVFHLWGHSWEIEQQSQWRTLEDLLAMVAEHRQELRFVTNGELCGCFASARETESIPSHAGCAPEVK